MINETGLWRLIDERIRNMGFAPHEVDLQSFYIDVTSFYQEEKLGQDTVVLVSMTIDIPYTAQLVIDAGNNKLETSREDHQNRTYAGYQFFQDQMNIHTTNYGTDFVPYRLEFIRISPNGKKQRP